MIVDHHRRSADYIENATLMFQEVYASSVAELVTELLQYAETKINLKTIEAESLYAGIMMDTKTLLLKQVLEHLKQSKDIFVDVE